MASQELSKLFAFTNPEFVFEGLFTFIIPAIKFSSS